MFKGELSVQDTKSVETFKTEAEIKSCECQKGTHTKVYANLIQFGQPGSVPLLLL